ncbi:MAG: protein-(glutamine-N5) methyltransferase, release factor-specific [Dehalococcoidia bacterium]|mgnify:FL=1|nr:protein-(glutamine-N5) methyltransferase, release factor-specific [Dehalococcoidia bacterium]MQG16036.1 peptide chain release factor N(5)-glutamine methyltransferase [SAR202 cluster bacterium]
MASLIGNNKLSLKNQEFKYQTIRSLWLKGVDQLKEYSIADSALECELLVRSALGYTKSDFYSHLPDTVTEHEMLLINQLIERRLIGEPTPYILGTKEFYGIEFNVSKDVLIPRPETELLVDLSLNQIKEGCLIADIGTGSGCIAVSIASHLPNVRIIAVDKSIEALKMAGKNIMMHDMIDRIDLLNSDLLTSFKPGLKFDLIVSNPPYVPKDIYETLDKEIQFEPTIALNGGTDGLDIIRRLLQQANTMLSDGGSLLFEVFSDNSNEAFTLTSELIPKSKVTMHTDLLGLPRVIEAQKLL